MVLTLGGNQRGEAKSVRFPMMYTTLVAEVAGTFLPTFGTGKWHGELQIAELWSTDTDLLTMLKAAANGDVPITTFTGAFTDTQATPVTKTYTITGRLNDVEPQWSAGEFTMANARVHEVVSVTDGTTTLP